MIPEDMQLYMTRAKIYDEEIMTSTAKVVIIYGEMNSTLEVSFRRWVDGYLMDIGKLVMVTQVRIKWSKENLKDIEEMIKHLLRNMIVRMFGLIYK